MRIHLLPVFLLVALASCSTLPPAVPLPAELTGTWLYVGGEPADDKLLSWKDWPDAEVRIEASGRWTSLPRVPGARTILPRTSRVIAVDGNVLTLLPETGGRAFQVYWRIKDSQLQFWWGDHADWLKPHVTYRRP